MLYLFCHPVPSPDHFIRLQGSIPIPINLLILIIPVLLLPPAIPSSVRTPFSMPLSSFPASSRSSSRFRVLRDCLAGSRGKTWPVVVGLLALGSVSVAGKIGPLIAWNHTPSLPEGLYVRSILARPAIGRIVAFPAPTPALDYARVRWGHGNPTLFLKPLAAGPGDHVCVTDHLEINGRTVAPVLTAGSDGIPLPRWNGCRMLGGEEWFAYAPRIPNSMDSRYYGPVQESDIVGVFQPVWTD